MLLVCLWPVGKRGKRESVVVVVVVSGRTAKVSTTVSWIHETWLCAAIDGEHSRNRSKGNGQKRNGHCHVQKAARTKILSDEENMIGAREMEWDIATGAGGRGQALTGKTGWIDDSSFRMICREGSPEWRGDQGRGVFSWL